jgi:hypothetical protein
MIDRRGNPPRIDHCRSGIRCLHRALR